MVTDAREVQSGTRLQTDVCIVGAGPAGITLALELADRGVGVLLVESGGFETDSPTTDLNVGEVVGEPYFDLVASRLRLFGGTSGHWEGMCRPLDSLDFETRAWIDKSGWPLSRTDLDPFYVQAHEYCQLGEFDYSYETWAPRVDIAPLGLPDTELVSEVYQFSPPTRFGEVYREQVTSNPGIDLLLWANLVDIVLSDDGAQVAELSLRTTTGIDLTVEPKRVVLALGAIENARVMLASRGVAGDGVGNANGLVGKYFMEHPHHVPAGFVLIERSDAEMGAIPRQVGAKASNGRDVRVVGCMRPTDAFQQDQGIGNAGLVLSELNLDGGAFSDPAGLKGLYTDGLDASTVQAMLTSPTTTVWSVDIRSEQVPSASSTITLTSDLDGVGVPRVAMDWQRAEIDQKTVTVMLDAAARAFGGAGVGRIWAPSPDMALPPSPPGGGFHHMGTTRMAVSEREGVVDADCKVHGLSNCWVAGSSVFPTSGFANPTLTIVALAIRLAEHLGS
ncbi:MAG: GMC family oxidoreductase [Acidimicrobiia bacterium]|nr:GMC family oxidoreductase [Acidimicrobiia bacterium]MBP8180287.1 GMC family oxidoreductase [Acidimicrobiia bacterium]